jgi:hypothetical protein
VLKGLHGSVHRRWRAIWDAPNGHFNGFLVWAALPGKQVHWGYLCAMICIAPLRAFMY